MGGVKPRLKDRLGPTDSCESGSIAPTCGSEIRADEGMMASPDARSCIGGPRAGTGTSMRVYRGSRGPDSEVRTTRSSRPSVGCR